MLNYRSEGKGTTVLLLHAFPLSSLMWERELEEIGRYARVLAPDLPGFGGSIRQQTPSLSGMAEEVAGLLDHLKIREPVVLGGLSMGGYVAFEFVRKFPTRIRGLMLFSTRASADTVEARVKRYDVIDRITKSGFEDFAKKISEKLVGRTSLQTRSQIVDKITAMILANKPEGTMDALRAMAERNDSTKLLYSIQAPCLIIAGEEDEIIPSSEAQLMCKQIVHAQVQTVLKAGHLVNLECPENFSLAVRVFLQAGVLNRAFSSAAPRGSEGSSDF